MPSIAMLQATRRREGAAPRPGRAKPGARSAEFEARSAEPGSGFTRRGFLGAMAACAATLALPRSVFAAPPNAFEAAAQTSSLVYVSPLLADGSESRCHGEVWFVVDGVDLLVVTAQDRWRATAIRRGHDRARLWVGEHGVWTRANEAWKKSPTRNATARFEPDAKSHARALELFGKKYSDEWGKWGPRFEGGLASGERVLIRYTPEPE